jgi:hypothetical protein
VVGGQYQQIEPTEEIFSAINNHHCHHLPLTTAVQFLSDLHLEAPKVHDVFNMPKAPYLALLGVIGHTRKTFLPC